jgi:hypothetical protein
MASAERQSRQRWERQTQSPEVKFRTFCSGALKHADLMAQVTTVPVVWATWTLLGVNLLMTGISRLMFGLSRPEKLGGQLA